MRDSQDFIQLKKNLKNKIKNNKIVIAVSGGPDSMVLLHAAQEVLPKENIFAVTVDHEWHNKSREVAMMVNEYCKEKNVKHYILKSKDLEKEVSLSGGAENAARNVRYQLLEQVMQETGSSYICVGHNANDQAETVLMGLFRGSGLKSLSGIAELRGNIFRPMLDIERKEIENISKNKKLKVWNDPANKDDKYTRVKVRKNVLPFVEKMFGQKIVKQLCKTAKMNRQDNDFLEELAEEKLNELLKNNTILIKDLQSLPNAIKTRVIKKYVELNSAKTEFKFSQIENISDAVNDWDKTKGKKEFCLPGVKIHMKKDTVSCSS